MYKCLCMFLCAMKEYKICKIINCINVSVRLKSTRDALL